MAQYMHVQPADVFGTFGASLVHKCNMRHDYETLFRGILWVLIGKCMVLLRNMDCYKVMVFWYMFFHNDIDGL